MQGAASLGAGGYGETPLARLLPVSIGGRDETVKTGEFRMTLTPAGETHPIFEGLEPYFRPAAGGAGAALPPFEVVNLVARSDAADAAVLAECAGLDAGEHPAPAVAAGRAGSGRAAVVAAGPTWRWAFAAIPRSPAGTAEPPGSRGRGRTSPHTRFWGQTVRWLAGEEEVAGPPGVTVRLDRGEALYGPGEAVTLYARVSGGEGPAGGGPVADAKVVASVRAAGGGGSRATGAALEEVRLSPSPGRPGEYEAVFTPAATGRHEVVVEAEAGGRAVGEAGIKFDVESPAREDERYDIDEETLVAVARASGGEYRRLSALDELVEGLRSRQSEKREAVVFPRWDLGSSRFPLLLFALLVAAAGSEWYLRRRMQMA